MLFRVVLLWCLDRAMDLVALAQGKPLTSQKRLQPLPAVPISFRAGWWGELHPDDAAQLDGCWRSHAIVDALLLFAPLPCAPSLDVVLSTKPRGFIANEREFETRGGVSVAGGQGPMGPMWLLWHSRATLIVAGKFASTTTPRTVRRFIQSAAVNDG